MFKTPVRPRAVLIGLLCAAVQTGAMALEGPSPVAVPIGLGVPAPFGPFNIEAMSSMDRLGPLAAPFADRPPAAASGTSVGIVPGPNRPDFRAAMPQPPAFPRPQMPMPLMMKLPQFPEPAEPPVPEHALELDSAAAPAVAVHHDEIPAPESAQVLE